MEEQPRFTLQDLIDAKERMAQYEPPAAERIVHVVLSQEWADQLRTDGVERLAHTMLFISVPVSIEPDMVGGRIVYADGSTQEFGGAPSPDKTFYETGVDPDLTGGVVVWVGIAFFVFGMLIAWLGLF